MVAGLCAAALPPALLLAYLSSHHRTNDKMRTTDAPVQAAWRLLPRNKRCNRYMLQSAFAFCAVASGNALCVLLVALGGGVCAAAMFKAGWLVSSRAMSAVWVCGAALLVLVTCLFAVDRWRSWQRYRARSMAALQAEAEKCLV